MYWPAHLVALAFSCVSEPAQDKAMRPVLEKGLQALSVQEVGDLLSYLGLDRFAADFKQHAVSSVFHRCFVCVESFGFYRFLCRCRSAAPISMKWT